MTDFWKFKEVDDDVFRAVCAEIGMKTDMKREDTDSISITQSDYPALSAWVEEQSLSLEEMETKVWKLPEFGGDFFIGLHDKKRQKSDDDLGFFFCPRIPKIIPPMKKRHVLSSR